MKNQKFNIVKKIKFSKQRKNDILKKINYIIFRKRSK